MSDESRSTRLGVAELDAEHRGQLERMDRLIAALERSEPLERSLGALRELVEYLEVHFMSEQIVMRERGYPAYDAHVREHDEAVRLLRTLGERCAAGDARAATDLLGALRGWLVEHIDSADRSLAEFLRQAAS